MILLFIGKDDVLAVWFCSWVVCSHVCPKRRHKHSAFSPLNVFSLLAVPLCVGSSYFATSENVSRENERVLKNFKLGPQNQLMPNIYLFPLSRFFFAGLQFDLPGALIPVLIH